MRIGPDPAVVMVVAPMAMMRRNVCEGVVADPNMALHGDVAPVAAAVRHVVDDGRFPIGLIIDVDPVAVVVQVRITDGRVNVARGGDGHVLPAERDAACAFAIPRIEGVLVAPVEVLRGGGLIARVDVGALTRGEVHGHAGVGMYACASPPDRYRRRAVVQNVDADLRIGVDAHAAHGGLENELAGARGRALEIERTGPSS